eukprot:CAMPEP_0181220834 /NCGR_PEP_ID=MMETSP1096-20121128/29055_1 /TAXON_ID=156174 ORGANISM="Chrysochromulina ericina, Strain CCMP281" /NCGR_SAMPLE_ID=MMETSP1096 /ASSEMBLY_ACC=CAM_ASM_000453 /LENGTH=213 /DNA_ID=CAMNT_0023313377 /DNA_START=258 /DNA_END=897 /DNA_ORIENTATION=-
MRDPVRNPQAALVPIEWQPRHRPQTDQLALHITSPSPVHENTLLCRYTHDAAASRSPIPPVAVASRAESAPLQLLMLGEERHAAPQWDAISGAARWGMPHHSPHPTAAPQGDPSSSPPHPSLCRGCERMLTLPASSPCRLAQRVKVPKSRRQDAPESHIPKALAEIRHVPPYEASQIVLQIEQIQREALPQRERADPQAAQVRIEVRIAQISH